MAFTWRRDSKAMFVTSITTAVAFLATSISKIMPISSFGIFASIVVPMNYILVIFVFPPFVVLSEKYCKCCCRRRKKAKEEDKEDDKEDNMVRTFTPTKTQEGISPPHHEGDAPVDQEEGGHVEANESLVAEVNAEPPQDSDSTKVSSEDVKIEKGTLLE